MIIDDEKIYDLDCGGLKIIQSPSGYCFTTDSVLLTSIVRANAKERIVELGSGSGIISILLSKKTTAKEIVGVEIQKRLFEMSQRSLMLNKLENKVVFINDDFKNSINTFGKGSFDVVVSNPPYEKKCDTNENEEIAICKSEIKCKLQDIIDISSSLLNYGGRFYSVIKSSRLADILTLMEKYKIVPKSLFPIQTTPKSTIEIFLIEGKKNGKCQLKVLAPLILTNQEGKPTKEVLEIYNRFSMLERENS